MVAMIQVRLPLLAARFPDLQNQILASLQVVRAENIQLIVDGDVVVLRRVCECESEHALLLQVRFVDASKAARDHCHASKVSRLQRRVLTAGSFAIVPVADDAPPDACVAVEFCHFGHRGDGVGDEVESLSAKRLGRYVAFCACEEVVGYVL